MVNNTLNSAVVPIQALLAGIKVTGDLKKKRRHFVIISIDDEIFLKSEKKPEPTTRWRWKDKEFLFHPSSTIKVAIYRASWTRLDFAKHLVGQHTEKVIELLDNRATIDLKNKKGAEIASKFKIKIKVPLDPEFEDTFKSFMKIVDDDISRLKSANLPSTATSVLRTFRKVFRLTKGIIDVVADAHPILRATWTVISVAYTAVKRAEQLDDAVGHLAESLREMLGSAKELADLPNLKVEGTTDVIEEIGRTSLKVASLIHEYATTPSFLGRAARAQFFDDLETRTKQYQETCDDLTRKFDRRVMNSMMKAVQHQVALPQQDFQQHFTPLRVGRDFQHHIASPQREYQHHVAPPERDFQHVASPQWEIQHDVGSPQWGIQHDVASPQWEMQHDIAPQSPQQDFQPSYVG